MNRHHHDQPKAVQRQPVIIAVSKRKGWALDEVVENGRKIIELRQLTRHGDGSFSPTGHRSTFRRENLPDLIAALSAFNAECR